MKYENESFYYNKIMGDSDQSCKQYFHNKWIAFLDSIIMPYKNALQLRIGSHLRPLLVYWGKALGSANEDDLLSEDILELAICVETLHKISIIVDDLIDNDTKRHNKLTFHIQYTPEETIIFAVYMMGKAFEKISVLSQKYNRLANPLNDIYAKTLQEMASGCLAELTMTPEKLYNYENIVFIIRKETSTLIKNSLLLGYLTNLPQNSEVIQIIEVMGDRIGYLFQTMNDLEPFCSSTNLIHHKGSLNMDFEHSRKNIVLPYIYASCSIREKKHLLKSKKMDTDEILYLFEKYNIKKTIKSDIKDTENEIEKYFNQLCTMDINLSCLNDFQKFYENIINIAKKRLKSKLEEPID
ncbi:MAG: hypothetical protein HFG39_16140 [Lachnospiraceae bacterium]|nr:hypothetical protein [Lachnospiraceae bacterium]